MEISIVIIAYNEEKDIRDCIQAILNQTVSDFELVIIDDGSTDNTGKVVCEFKDSRILYFKSKKNQGYASARNKGIEHSKGKFIFFTDADCVPKADWLSQGLKKIKESETIAEVGGKTYFGKNKGPYSLSDRTTFEKAYFPSRNENIFSTHNAVYRRTVLESVSGFDPRYNDGGEDIDLAIRILKSAGFLFKYNQNMVVYHKPKSFKFSEGFSVTKRLSNHLLLIKDHKDYLNLLRSYAYYWRICLPLHFISLFFPPALYWIFKYKNKKIKNVKDVLFLVPFYFSLVLLRIYIWKKAFQEKVFII